jgi:hypothetical protein
MQNVTLPTTVQLANVDLVMKAILSSVVNVSNVEPVKTVLTIEHVWTVAV